MAWTDGDEQDVNCNNELTMKNNFLLSVISLILLKNLVGFGQMPCNITFSQYDSTATKNVEYIIDLLIKDNRNNTVFEWPEVIGEAAIYNIPNGHRIICFGNILVPVDTAVVYKVVPYCEILIDTNKCSVRKSILLSSPALPFDSIKLNYLHLKRKFGKKKIEKISKGDEVKIMQLCFTLTTAAISGCKECLPIFLNLRKDFSVFMYGLNASDYTSCKTAIDILRVMPRADLTTWRKEW